MSEPKQHPIAVGDVVRRKNDPLAPLMTVRSISGGMAYTDHSDGWDIIATAHRVADLECWRRVE